MSVKDTDGMPVVPEQWKPENQDPSVAYSVNAITGEVTYFGDAPEEDAPKRKGGRPKKQVDETPVQDDTSGELEEPAEPSFIPADAHGEPAEAPAEEPAEPADEE